MEQKQPKTMKCKFCNYEWVSNSQLQFISCPSCLKKNELRTKNNIIDKIFRVKRIENKKLKTMVEIYQDDRRDLHFVKISTNAKNIPSVLKKAIKLLKEQVEKEQENELS